MCIQGVCLGVCQGVCSQGVTKGCAKHPQTPPRTQNQTSPMHKMTDRYKNITLPQTSFAGGM